MVFRGYGLRNKEKYWGRYEGLAMPHRRPTPAPQNISALSGLLLTAGTLTRQSFRIRDELWSSLILGCTARLLQHLPFC